MNIRKLFTLTAAFCLLLNTGCGGGNGSNGGINGTGKQTIYDGLVVGVVDGFGSVIINDKRCLLYTSPSPRDS